MYIECERDWLMLLLIDGLMIDDYVGRVQSLLKKISLLVNYLSRDNHYQLIKMSKGPLNVM